METTVTTLRRHGNSFGEAYRKEKGDSYACPADVAAKLAALGLVEVGADENDVQGQRVQGTGKGPKRAGKDGNAQNGGAKGGEGSS